jgi:hypothetical protein
VKPFIETLWVTNPVRQSRASSRKRVLLRPPEMLALVREAGFKEARHLSAVDLTQRYFAGRTDGLRPSSGEAFLLSHLPVKRYDSNCAAWLFQHPE